MSLSRKRGRRRSPDYERMCSKQSLDEICDRAAIRLHSGSTALAALVLPGSFNPVHSEHIRSLELARSHLAGIGTTVVAAFLQPSSDDYVAGKVGAAWAMSLADRISTCELAAQANASTNGGDSWIYAWRSGQANGFAVARHVGEFLGTAVSERCGGRLSHPIEAYMVCGVDVVLRWGKWERPIHPPAVVVARPGVALPETQPGKGWHVAEGDTQPASSTQIREAIGAGRWERLLELGCEPSVVEFMRTRSESGTLFMAQ
mmetsp:Transcript_100079/g.317896  ORF Transcript_100079/g.317896 Transcript_100079/m.317896 type:complete len:260 (-) Transcript_100079:59-838(-)